MIPNKTVCKACVCGRMLIVVAPEIGQIVQHRCICGRYVEFKGSRPDTLQNFQHKKISIPKYKVYT